jgi:hypothetical protein
MVPLMKDKRQQISGEGTKEIAKGCQRDIPPPNLLILLPFGPRSHGPVLPADVDVREARFSQQPVEFPGHVDVEAQLRSGGGNLVSGNKSEGR